MTIANCTVCNRQYTPSDDDPRCDLCCLSGKFAKEAEPDNVIASGNGNDDPITLELVEHLRDRICVLIADDPKFKAAVDPIVNASWKPGELHERYIQRAFARAFILEM